MTVEQVMQMSAVEYQGWIQYFDFVNKEAQKNAKKMRRR